VVVLRSRSEKIERSFVNLPIILGPIILFSATLFTGQVLYWGLPSLQFIPWRFFAWENIQEGILPVWNALNGMGAPLAANYQLALFYPPGWLVYLFAAMGGISWMAWAHTLLIVLHLIWAGLGMANLARKIGLQPLAQCLCGLTFSLSGYFVARGGFFSMIWAGAWIPWIFLFASDIGMPVRGRADGTRQKLLNLPLIFAVTFQLLAGHAQLSWYTLTLVATWVLLGGWVNSGFNQACWAFGKYSLAVAVGIILSSIQLIPTFQYLLQSQRSSAVGFDTAMTYSFWPWRILSLFAPDFFGNPGSGNYWGYASFWEDAAYIGLVPILLAGSTFPVLFSKKYKSQPGNFRPLVIFLWSFAFLGILLALGKNTLVFPFLYRYVPSFSMFQAPSRYMIWFVFAFCLLVGIGVEKWHTPTGRGLYWFHLATAGTAAVTIGAILAGLFIKGDIHFTFIQAAALAGIWGLGGGILTLLKTPSEKRGKRLIWETGVILWVSLDLISAGWNLNPSLPSSFYQAMLPGNNAITRPINSGQRVYLNPGDEYLLKFNRFFRFDDYRPIEKTTDLGYVLLPNLNLIEGISFVNNFDPLLPARFAKWMDNLAGMSAAQVRPWLTLMDVGVQENLDINTPLGVSFMPQMPVKDYYWTNCAQYASTADEAWVTLTEEMAHLPDGQPFHKVVLEEDNKSTGVCGQAGYAMIDQNLSSNGLVQLQVSSDQSGWLVAANTWYPGWAATVDGQNVPLLRANYLFQAVRVPAGIHKVVLIYRPVVYYTGACVSLLGFIVLFFYKFRQKR